MLVSLLDSHPELLVLPEETAYFPTVLTKYGQRSRREQFDYLTQRSLSNVLFGGKCKWGKRAYTDFPTRELRASFERAAFAPANAHRDLLVILLECYAGVLGRPLDSVRYWVEKTPANRSYLDHIFHRFPRAKVLLTLRDPRALLAAQIQLEQGRNLRRFSIYLTVKHWRTAARLALRQQQSLTPDHPDAISKDRLLILPFEGLLQEPARWLENICGFLQVAYQPSLLQPTKAGRHWAGNSAAGQSFEGISAEPVDRWKRFLTEEEVGWVEWHCRDFMEPLGYTPTLSRRSLKHWAKPVRGETPKEYLKSRLYSLRPWPAQQSRFGPEGWLYRRSP